MTIRRHGFSVLLLVSLMALAGCANEPSVVRTVVRLTATGGAVVVTATGGPAGVTPAAPAAAATQTPQAGSTPAPQNTPAAGATEEVGERVVLQFVTTLSTIEEVDHIADLLSDEDGILAVTGTEVSLTITYDPAAITIDQLKAVMERIGYPVK